MGIFGNIAGGAKGAVEGAAVNEFSQGMQKGIQNAKNRPKVNKCPKCGKPIAQDGLKFCPACGAPLMATCQKCGSAFPVGTKFCTNCGGTLA
jgi:rRNA maturation endonuclease Nob1